MTAARKIFSSLLALVLVVNAFVVALFTTATPVDAARLQTAKVTLSDPRSTSSSSYTFQFSIPTAATLNEFRFRWTTSASGSSQPSALNLDNATLGTLTNMDAGWTLVTPDADEDTLVVQHTNAGEAFSAGEVVVIPFGAILNSDLDDCQASVTTSDTCFVQIEAATATSGTMGSNVSDNTVVTYTITQGVTVSATVQPSFTFVVSSVGASTVVGGITTTTASTTSTLPFGNLTAAAAKYMAHQLNVTTNAQSGYSVTVIMQTQMAGTYSGNNIDPFGGEPQITGGATWSNPLVWTEPTGTTPNTNTGWIGAYTSDTDVSGFDAQEFGPVNSTQNTVMSSTASDNGSVGIYVNYAIEANVYQPADTYTGTVVYNAVATY